MYIDISKLGIPHPVFSFDFRTLMLFRCTKRKFAYDFMQGKLFFNTPKNWIAEGHKGNKGQGDALEGTFFSTPKVSPHAFANTLKLDPGVVSFEYDGYVYFRRKSIEDIPCVCFYGLNDNEWEKSVDARGRAHWKKHVPRSYFTDFSGGIASEEYEKIQIEEQPVVVIINNPHAFFEIVKKKLNDLGVALNEIIISPVEYLDKHSSMVSLLRYPSELLIKDIAFAAQKEIRIMINSSSEEFHKYLKEHSNIIDVGDISRYIDIQDYYFSDMEIERLGNKKISFSLPKPITKISRWYSMNIAEILQEYARISWECSNDKVECEKRLLPLNQFIEKNYGIRVSSSDKPGIIIEEVTNGASDRVFNEIKKHEEPNNNFHQRIRKILSEAGYQRAIEECRASRTDDRIFPIPYSEELRIYKLEKNETEFLQFCNYCLDNDLIVFEVLNSRYSYYFEKCMYREAFDDLEKLQDYIGYDPSISFNKGLCLIHLGDYKRAIDIFTGMMKTSPSDASLYYNRGVAYYKAKKYEQARLDMIKAIELEPSNKFYKEEFSKI